MKTQNLKEKAKRQLKVALLFIAVLFTYLGQAQDLTQTIRGRIVDADSKMPAIGASVVVVGIEPFKGAASDIDGYFKIENVPVGRVSLNVTYVGYEPQTLSNIVVTSAKEVFLNIALTENIKQLEAFEVSANGSNDEPINEMAIISSRKFSVEEAGRYAGSFNDPARMASNFAGVSGDPGGNNDIVVRGNSPKGILWRLEGIEIPNPNHFADEGATGGPINALNSKVLANSEFMSGAFAPEYGNATSGVLDLKLRQGNNQKREYAVGIGVLGMDVTAEGPFKEGGRGSYLANYRYSSLAVLDDAGIVDFGGVPKYQDAAFNVHLPTTNAGVFSVFGLGGISKITETEVDSNDETYVLNQGDYNAQFGFAGVSHFYPVNNNTYIKNTISIANNGSGYTYHERNENGDMFQEDEAKLNKNALKINSTVNSKLNSKNTVTAGVIHTQLNYGFYNSYTTEEGDFYTDLDISENSNYSQAFATWKHRFTEDLTLVTGSHFMHFRLNNTYSVEPRVGLNYTFKDRHTFSAGFGVHSRLESLLFYTTSVVDNNGKVGTPNTDLEIPKANHYVFGYDFQVAPNTHFKTELYYQQLYDVPVENRVGSSYSLINQTNWFDNIALQSTGTGENYGVEFTLERYFAKNFYYLATASLFESKYTAMDGIQRPSRFSGNYNGNIVLGKEFVIGKEDQNALQLNFKTTVVGGQRYTPVDLEASRISETTVRVKEPLSAKADDVFFMNVSAVYRINKKKTSHEIKLEVLNATNNKARIIDYYDSETGKVDYQTQLEIIPNLMYTLNF